MGTDVRPVDSLTDAPYLRSGLTDGPPAVCLTDGAPCGIT